MLYAALNFARPADSGCVHNFNFALVVAYNRPVNVACGASFEATIACCFLARVLNKLDLPTFGRPSSAIYAVVIFFNTRFR
jgi:hypothetical protein